MDDKFQQEFKEKCLVMLRNFTGHENVKIVDSGDMAIFFSFFIAKQMGKSKVLILDQGGWLTYKTYPEIFGMGVEEVKTKDGLIDLTDLKEKADPLCALIIPSFGGYFVQEPLQEIAEICKEKQCLLIEDASAVVGDEFLCNGTLSDVIVGSFGKWKVVNLGYGGFISVRNKEWFDVSKEVFSLSSFFPQYIELYQKLQKAQDRLEWLMGKCEEVKGDLSSFDVLFPESRCLVVTVALHLEGDKEKLVDYCKEKGLEYTECPRYIRVDKNAISIEVKRLEN